MKRLTSASGTRLIILALGIGSLAVLALMLWASRPASASRLDSAPQVGMAMPPGGTLASQYVPDNLVHSVHHCTVSKTLRHTKHSQQLSVLICSIVSCTWRMTRCLAVCEVPHGSTHSTYFRLYACKLCRQLPTRLMPFPIIRDQLQSGHLSFTIAGFMAHHDRH